MTGQVFDCVPKTQAGLRTLALDDDSTEALIGHRRSQWTSPDPDGYVFCWPDRRPLRPDWLTHRFGALVRQSKLPPVRLHDLRHGAATLALAAGADIRVVQDMLGHTNYAFTADTYTSVLSHGRRAAAHATAKLLTAARYRCAWLCLRVSEPVVREFRLRLSRGRTGWS